RLLLDANRAVAADRLIGDLWGDNAPASAPKMVQIFVSQLRKALPDAVLLTRRPGYVVSVSPDAVDVNRFNRLRVEGRAALEAGDAPAAAALLVQALGLWRGPALAEFSEPFAEAERIHLEELRLTCLEDRIEADLALGRHDDVVAEVTALVAEHPFRERPHRHLILGLYRAGRQAEALEAYERSRPAARNRAVAGAEGHPAKDPEPRFEPGARFPRSCRRGAAASARARIVRRRSSRRVLRARGRARTARDAAAGGERRSRQHRARRGPRRHREVSSRGGAPQAGPRRAQPHPRRPMPPARRRGPPVPAVRRRAAAALRFTCDRGPRRRAARAPAADSRSPRSASTTA